MREACVRKADAPPPRGLPEPLYLDTSLLPPAFLLPLQASLSLSIYHHPRVETSAFLPSWPEVLLWVWLWSYFAATAVQDLMLSTWSHTWNLVVRSVTFQ